MLYFVRDGATACAESPLTLAASLRYADWQPATLAEWRQARHAAEVARLGQLALAALEAQRQAAQSEHGKEKVVGHDGGHTV